MPLEWKKTSCYNCGVCCGLEVQIKDNQVVNVRPDKASMRSLGGYCCRKGRALKYFQHNKNRLDYPLKRVGDEFVRISWEQALSEIGEKVREIRKNYSPKAFGVYGVGLAVDHVAMYPLQDLKTELIYINEFPSPKELRKGIRHYVEEYNSLRPHEALDYAVPDDFYFAAFSAASQMDAGCPLLAC